LAIEYLKQGIILQLIEHTKQVLHPQAKIVLLSAPQAVDYYPHIGFTQHMSAWTKSKKTLGKVTALLGSKKMDY